MQVHESGAALVLQPETEVEATALNRLMGMFKGIEDAPMIYFTLDLGNYPDLDHDLFNSAVFAPDRDRYDPGARALVFADEGGEA